MVADEFPEVTVLFCEICNFHSFASRYNAHIVISVLNIIYSKFDSLIDKYKVHKVRVRVTPSCPARPVVQAAFFFFRSLVDRVTRCPGMFVLQCLTYHGGRWKPSARCTWW